MAQRPGAGGAKSGDAVAGSRSRRSTGERILDATLRVLARRGGSRLSMSEVARTAGVSRMTLYRYFATKEDLLRALARHEQRRFDERLERALAGAAAPDEQVDAVLREIVSFQSERATRAVVDAEPGFILTRMRRALPVQRRTLERLIGDALERSPAVRSGGSTPGDVAELLLRVAMSHFLMPARDPDALLRVLRTSIGVGPGERARRRRAS